MRWRKKALKKQGKEIRDPTKRRKMNEKFKFLDDALRRVKVVRSEKSLRSGQIQLFDIYLRRGPTLTVSEFLELAKPQVLNTLQNHNDSKRVKFTLSVKMEKYCLLASSEQLVDSDERHISTKFMELFHATDINELYETKKKLFN